MRSFLFHFDLKLLRKKQEFVSSFIMFIIDTYLGILQLHTRLLFGLQSVDNQIVPNSKDCFKESGSYTLKRTELRLSTLKRKYLSSF